MLTYIVTWECTCSLLHKTELAPLNEGKINERTDFGKSECVEVLELYCSKFSHQAIYLNSGVPDRMKQSYHQEALRLKSGECCRIHIGYTWAQRCEMEHCLSCCSHCKEWRPANSGGSILKKSSGQLSSNEPEVDVIWGWICYQLTSQHSIQSFS